MILARWCADPSSDARRLLHCHAALELGTGVGVSGLAAALYAAPSRVVLTDLHAKTVRRLLPRRFCYYLPPPSLPTSPTSLLTSLCTSLLSYLSNSLPSYLPTSLPPYLSLCCLDGVYTLYSYSNVLY